ncbi:unnamed protein product [Penicillium salamii]|uniref:Zn(2)-C6 fungal-type domain-containing protein n=1 Tax=Penicillium salamii TaxID=1612424 RepID=A0A9W4IV99_9EURO|nr:unnamed protein product [Penicillium salamii]CAG8042685.1 unnamed protein product [Penicillium salamii]CAG8340485.1 unnamed protein product [Penicillium salamii]CAG8344122.1 unnamed protein product [Penicillium salamii]CAG8344290.1 unnamed protein product [Penicillium salamii]
MGARSRQGCLPCRRRKKKSCDWPAPSFQQTQTHSRSSFDHPKLRTQSFWAKQPNGLAHIPLSLPSLFICRPNSFGPHTQKLIYHYVNDTANKIVCLQDNDNPFLHTIFPTAFGDDLLMHAILALSGAHLMQRLPLASREIQRSTWFNYARALKALRVGLSDGFQSISGVAPALHALLVVLIFYITEACTNIEAMGTHLRGANHLMDYILRTNPASIQSSLGSYIMEVYVYHASLASFTVRGSDLAILQSNLKAENLAFQHGKVGMLSGCTQYLFGLMPKVSVLLQTITEARGRPDSQGHQFIQDYRDFRSSIADWEPVCTELGAVHCASLYKLSISLLLDAQFQPETREKKARHAFDDLKLLLSHLPPSAPYATTVTWPLFIFGMVARQEEEVEMIRTYLHSLISAFGIGLMGTTLAYLERVWKNDNHLDGLHGLVSNQNNMPLIC